MASITPYKGKKGITYNASVRKHGIYKHASFPTKRMAEDWARQQEHEITQEKYFGIAPQKETHTMGELLDYYKTRILPQKSRNTQVNQGRMLAWWDKNLHDTNVKHVDFKMLDRCKSILMR